MLKYYFKRKKNRKSGVRFRKLTDDILSLNNVFRIG